MRKVLYILSFILFLSCSHHQNAEMFLEKAQAVHLAGYSQDYKKYSNVDFLTLTISSPQLDSILSDCISQFEKRNDYSENISLAVITKEVDDNIFYDFTFVYEIDYKIGNVYHTEPKIAYLKYKKHDVFVFYDSKIPFGFINTGIFKKVKLKHYGFFPVADFPEWLYYVKDDIFYLYKKINQ